MSDNVVNINDKKVNLSFGLQDINILIAGLDEIPHKFSRSIIDYIIEEAKKQVPGVEFRPPTN